MPKYKVRGEPDLLDEYVVQAERALRERDELRRQVARMRKAVARLAAGVNCSGQWRERAERAEGLLREYITRRSDCAYDPAWDEFDQKVVIALPAMN
jgi:hypothetical protein